MAGGAGGVLAEEARTRGGARPRVGRNLDGRMHLMDGGGGATGREGRAHKGWFFDRE